MLKALALICFATSAILGFSQVYKPHKGETDLKLEIQDRGTVYIQLFVKEAPKTTAQIMKLVKSGFYDTQRFHRVEKSPKPYIVQIGDPNSKTGDLDKLQMSGGSGDQVPFEESGHQNVEGAVGLARDVTNQNSGNSQFYISLGTNKFLDGTYTVFGQVVSGMDIVQKIERGDRVTSATIVVGT
jgi:cyclophilin family peptidyl-prolyl cis-trans isomerase